MGVREVSGTATLAGFTVNHRFGLPGLPPPYVVAQVAIDEDPRVRLTTNIVDCDPGTLELGQRLEVVFRQDDDVSKALPEGVFQRAHEGTVFLDEASEMALKSAESGMRASSNQKIAAGGGVPMASWVVASSPSSAMRVTMNAPVMPMLRMFNTEVAMLNVMIVNNLPHAISLRSAGLQCSVSNVPRSFSPAHRSIAG